MIFDNSIDLNASAKIGKICSLMSQDKYYCNFLLRDIRRTVIPPVSLGQCILLKWNGKISGFITYATVSESVEREIILADRRVQPEHWASGDNLWIIDAIINTPKISKLRQPLFSIFKEFEEVRYVRRDAQQEIKAVLKYRREGDRFVTVPYVNSLKGQ